MSWRGRSYEGAVRRCPSDAAGGKGGARGGGFRPQVTTCHVLPPYERLIRAGRAPVCSRPIIGAARHKIKRQTKAAPRTSRGPEPRRPALYSGSLAGAPITHDIRPTTAPRDDDPGVPPADGA